MLTSLVLASSGNGFILPHDFNEVIWGTIAFLIVAGVLWWKGMPAAINMARARTQRIADELAEAAEARQRAEAALADLQSRIANADAECASITTEADETAASLRAQLIAKADADADEARRRGDADAEVARSQVAQGLETELGRMAVGAAEAVIANSLDAEAQAALIDRYIDQVGADR